MRARALSLASATQAAAQTKLFTGTVVDSARRPVSNAEVAIGGLNLARTVLHMRKKK